LKSENILPINAFYITWLRDKGWCNRPRAVRADKNTGEIISEKTQMDSIDMLIYIMLLSRADKNTLTCFPSIATICDDCKGLDRRTVWDHLQDLAGMKFIEIEKNPGRPNIYHMLDFARWRDNPRY